MSAFQEETLSGHKVIISNNRSDWAAERHEQHVDGVYKVGRRAFMASLMQFPITQTLSLVQNVLVLVTGTFLVIEGSTTLGTVLAFAGYSALLASPLAEMANLITATLNAAAGGDRVFRIIDERPDVVDAPDAVDYEFRGGRSTSTTSTSATCRAASCCATTPSRSSPARASASAGRRVPARAP